MFRQGLLSPLGMGSEGEKRSQQVCHGAVDETGTCDLGNGGRGVDLQLAYFFPWLEWSVGSQGVHTGVGV